MDWIEDRTRKPAPPRHASCSICSGLGAYHHGFQKYGREDEDTFLLVISSRLQNVKEIDPGRRPTETLQKCPECGTYYLYTTEYEFLATGSEDEQTLSRLTDEEAARYLGRDPA